MERRGRRQGEEELGVRYAKKRGRGTHRGTLLTGGFGTRGINGRRIGSTRSGEVGRKWEDDNTVQFGGFIRGERVTLVRDIGDTRLNTLKTARRSERSRRTRTDRVA